MTIEQYVHGNRVSGYALVQSNVMYDSNYPYFFRSICIYDTHLQQLDTALWGNEGPECI